MMNTVLIAAAFGVVVATAVFVALGVSDWLFATVSVGALVGESAIVLVGALVAACTSVCVGAVVGD